MAKVKITETVLRDAHQSLAATRMTTEEMLPILEALDAVGYNALEAWGGATFDVAYRFLKESPWVRLQQLRAAMPNTLIQMLLRASNAVGYANYPDNVVQKFIEVSAERGIDVFRIFDSLNWVENMKMPIEVALNTGKIVEGSICYTGDILDPNETKYTLDYEKLSVMDKWLLSKMNSMVKDVDKNLGAYKIWRLWAVTSSQSRIWQVC